MGKYKFECETVEICNTKIKKKVTLRYGKNANAARIWVEAEQINFKVLVICIFIQTTEKGSFEVNNIMKSVKGRMKEWPFSAWYDENKRTRNLLTALNGGKSIESYHCLLYEQLNIQICLLVGEGCWPWDLHLWWCLFWRLQASCIFRKAGTADEKAYLMCHQTVQYVIKVQNCLL